MMKQTLRALAELARPANIVTAYADILAGFAVAGGSVALLLDPTGRLVTELIWLLAATTGLYGGGVVFNDYFDADLDRQERPERPIPSGRISEAGAAWFGSALFLLALIAASQVNAVAFGVTGFILFAALIYNSAGKQSAFWGPVLMGLCRGGNLLLGIAITPVMILTWWPLALIPIFYIGSVTLISRGEVTGGDPVSARISLSGVVLILLVLLLLPTLEQGLFLHALPFLVVFAAAVLPLFYNAVNDPSAENIRQAVKRGVLSQVLLNAVLAATFAGWGTGLVTLSLLPLSLLLARRFSVT